MPWAVPTQTTSPAVMAVPDAPTGMGSRQRSGSSDRVPPVSTTGSVGSVATGVSAPCFGRSKNSRAMASTSRPMRLMPRISQIFFLGFSGFGGIGSKLSHSGAVQLSPAAGLLP